MTRKKRLGRGLEALLGALPESDIANGSVVETDAPPTDGSTSDIVHLSVYEIDDIPFQPRRRR